MAEAATTRSKLGNVYPLDEIESQNGESLRELRSMYNKLRCADCAATPANWATLKRATFVCIDCAQKLRADATNKVKNCLGTYLWHPDEMQVMRNGNK